MQTIREAVEQREKETLSNLAALSCATKGRLKKEPKCCVRTEYQRDRDRIIHSKAFRRLKHKTQVFISPTGDHYRTRLTHTLEASQIGRTIARALMLNEDLAEAIILGHDLGHTPFGHAGEAVIDRLLKKYGLSFDHNEQSLYTADEIEKLNLTWEVRDGILNHPWSYPKAKTLEGQIARFADRIAYINHDIDDAIRSGILKRSDIPKKYLKIIKNDPLDVFVMDVIENSSGKNEICMSRRVETALHGLYRFMFKNVYAGKQAKFEEKKIDHIITALFNYYLKNPIERPGYKKSTGRTETIKAVRDFIAGMTDRYAVLRFNDLFVPDEWKL